VRFLRGGGQFRRMAVSEVSEELFD
jgi:hypothetical protein